LVINVLFISNTGIAMSNLIRCPSCRGRKQLYGAGMLMKDCDLCGAIGYINDEVSKEIKREEEKEMVIKEKTIKKPKEKATNE
jgi:hypothetical protein